MLIGMIGSIWDWVIVIAVVLILFGGYNKVPELFRALGRAVGEFKKGQVEVERELRQLTTEPQSPPQVNQNTQAVVQQNAQTNNGQSSKDKEVEELRKQIEQLKKEIESMRSKGSQ
ncbi:twin-arginine translocase TatA/TatE family subunit [Caldivirga sp.]|uniref:twin-arginine translocase TatA/TatE family subunit n=1 Tax=Caldivirga sp. TaxID=2080243 RepID=UPI0025C49F0F|nr:twin-arginine translocase TatA/TatE family subunit [Caldivirga sp.]